MRYGRDHPQAPLKMTTQVRQRAQQISIEQAPPTLRMVIVKDEIIPTDLTVWDLPITVESK